MKGKNLSNFLFLLYMNPFLFLMENIPLSTLKLIVLAMGSLLGPPLAYAFLCHFEKKGLSECPVEFLLEVYKRYVDNIFVTFDSYAELLKFVDYMNHQHPTIKIAFEVQKNKNFSFLKVKFKFVEQTINLPPLFSGNLPLVAYLLTLIVL